MNSSACGDVPTRLPTAKTCVAHKNVSSRWIASMVADGHRMLIRGCTSSTLWDKDSGKLRVMCAANPMRLLVEQARAQTASQCSRH